MAGISLLQAVGAVCEGICNSIMDLGVTALNGG